MNDSSNGPGNRDREDFLDEQKRTDGQSAHRGDLEGSSAADAGKVQAPQKGDPHSDARQS